MTLRHGTRPGFVRIWKLRKWLPAVLAAAAGIGGTPDWVLASPPSSAPVWGPATTIPVAFGQPTSPAPRAVGQPFARGLRDNRLGVRLGDIHPELAGHEPAGMTWTACQVTLPAT